MVLLPALANCVMRLVEIAILARLLDDATEVDKVLLIDAEQVKQNVLEVEASRRSQQESLFLVYICSLDLLQRQLDHLECSVRFTTAARA